MLEPPVRAGVRDADIGIKRFLTTTPPLGGRLKVRIEDFEVDEVGLELPRDPSGRFTAARIRLANWETNRFVHEASAQLGISRKKIHFSGTKDKRGVTTQQYTFEAAPEAVQELARLPGVEVLDAFRTSRELTLGAHLENAFRVVIRDVEGPRDRVERIVHDTGAQLAAGGGCPNFFGPQRFGTLRATTHRVGERMLRGDFLGAVLVYLTAPGPRDPPDLARAREELERTKDWKAALPHFAGDYGFERALLHRLGETGGDAAEALKSLPENLQWLFVYAYQSFLFNRILSARLEAGFPIHRAVEGDLIAPIERGELVEEWIPVMANNLERVNEEVARGRAAVTGLLPGTDVPFASGTMGEIERRILTEERVEPRDFLIPEHLPWSSKGTRRAFRVAVSDFSSAVEPDDLHPGRWKVRTAFRLPRGAYATTALREFLKSPWQEDYA